MQINGGKQSMWIKWLNHIKHPISKNNIILLNMCLKVFSLANIVAKKKKIVIKKSNDIFKQQSSNKGILI